MSDRLLTRNASPRPTTADELARTVELVIATETDVGDGVVLSCRKLPEHGPAPVPVLLSHQNDTSAMAGRIRSLRIEGSQLIGLAEFTDAPAAEQGWQLARSGCAVSVNASVPPDGLQRHSANADLATRWRLREASLVPVGADPTALVRSFNPSIMTTDNNTAAAVDAAETIERSPADQKHELAVRRAASNANLDEETVQRLIVETKGQDKLAIVTACVREHRLKVERNAPVTAGHPARIDTSGPADPVKDAIERAMTGKALPKPLAQVFREAGYTGRNDEDVVRNAFIGHRSDTWLQRGFHSTSDAKELLLSTGDRRLQDRFAEPPRGIMELARTRTLADFREVSVVDAGLVGTAKEIKEGGEIKFGSIQDSAGEYKATRYGLGLSFSFEALKNDDLGGLDLVLQEAGQTMIEREADALTALLTTGANGANSVDGKALFHADHANSATAAMSTEGITSLILLLRNQKSVGGRQLWLEPGYIVVGPELEATAMKLLSDAWAPAAPADVNPWRNLRLIVEPALTGATYYLVASGPRKPFELGRVDGMPRTLSEEAFSTSAMRMKVEHAFGCAVADHRVIVRGKPA